MEKPEPDINETTNSLINKYIMDSEPKIDFSDTQNKNNFKDKMKCLAIHRNSLPLYLQGFMKYNREFISKKFLLIKIYGYLEKINPYKNNYMISKLYQGYALYEILTHENIPNINFNTFNQIKKKRLRDKEVKSILELAIKILQKRSHADFVNTIKENNITNLKFDSPKIVDIFDIVDEYYKDLNNQLNYYLSQYLVKNISCIIISEEIQRILWLNFCKFLLLNLSEKDINKKEIKIILIIM